ncbi:uncharacterized protein YjiS (DUF1127 family) [Sulfitobacter undariae]|uniref:Uncharacterized protein YjiS (DUF1127 family) n=1 Tax=Sulfitobacter undariae TaxID=1563671 RepID=A0A7W6GYM8_9RHOB|nr:hypothetical protein [Sulfitobacter undariae]MBB3993016.1 uncharacterized protein YjiS (DUF1127 family) [Sulfitobacter undariae]
MTYANPSEQFAARIPARGQSNSSLPFLSADRGLNVLGRFFTGIFNFMIKIAESSSRCEQVAALQAKSDDELAAMGIKRDEIVHFVFRDRFYA